MRASRKSKANKIADFFIKQIKENRTRFFTAAGFTIGFILLGGFILLRFQTVKETSSDRLAAAYMSLMDKNEQEATAHLNSAIVYARNTPASYQARLVKADMMADKKEYGQALELLKETEEKGNPELIKPLALARIIYIYDQQNDYDNAILYANEFINKYYDSFLIKDIYSGLARFYLITEAVEDAKRVYNEILAKFPATAEAEKAEKALQEMK